MTRIASKFFTAVENSTKTNLALENPTLEENYITTKATKLTISLKCSAMQKPTVTVSHQITSS